MFFHHLRDNSLYKLTLYPMHFHAAGLDPVVGAGLKDSASLTLLMICSRVNVFWTMYPSPLPFQTNTITGLLLGGRSIINSNGCFGFYQVCFICSHSHLI
jgi:hypothetical protein